MLIAACLILINCSASIGYIGIHDGLSSRNVTCMIQDKYGLIWIGTENGLNVYDGYSFKTYSTYTKDLRISNVRISSLFEARDGSLWVGTFSGLNHISADRKSNTIINGTAPLRITSVNHFRDSRIIFAADDGSIYSVNNDQAVKVFSLGKRCGLFGLVSDAEGAVFFHTDCERNICKLKSDFTRDPSFIFEDTLNSRFALTGSTLIASCESAKGMVFIDSKNLSRKTSASLDRLNAEYPDARGFFVDSENNLWTSYRNGILVKTNLHTGALQNYSSYFIHDYFGSKISCFLEDKQGMIWIGTDGGIVKIAKGFNQFTANNLSADDHVSTRGIITDKDRNIYITSDKGLFVVDHKTHTSINYRVGETPFKNENNFIGLHWADEQNLMIATFHKGLINFNLPTKRFTPLVSNDTSIFNKNLLCIFKDHANTIWIGSHKGLLKYDPGRKNILPYYDATQNPVLAKTSIWQIIEYRKMLWLATPKGLFCLDPQRGTLKHYNLHSGPALPGEDFYGITVDDEEHLWLACRGAGIIRFNTITHKTEQYTTENGLSNSVTYGIIKHNGYLWISTENGLSRFNIKTKSFINYFAKDGLADDEFNAGSCYESPDGKIIMGGINGITSFYPDNIPDRSRLSRLIITRIEAGDSIYDNLNTLNSNLPATITLPYYNTNLSISMAITDYYHPAANTYSYKISGLDDEWINLGAQHLIRLNQIRPGKYTLLIMGRNYNGIETINTISLHLDAEEVFYKRTWFIVLCCLLILSVIYLFFNMRIRQLLKLQKLRTKIASDLHDEVGSMLTRISILAEMLKFKNRDSEEVRQIAIASNKATTTMSDMLWSIDSRNDKLENLIDRMREHADSLLLPLNIAIDFQANGISEGKIIGMLLRQNLLFIFKEAINNIAKHSGATAVHIVLNIESQVLTMKIIDNGKGELNNTTGSGLGLSNMSMRAKEVKAALSIESDNGYRILFTKKL